jgi:carbon monoxide dehydrogenase subunit G
VRFATGAAIAAPREQVFAALVSPDLLRRCIPGCEELTDTGNDTYQATIKVGMAGLHGIYSGTASLRDRVPPESFTLSFDGKGGAGFARGTARLRFEADGDQTRVACDADVHVGGVIAAIGSRLVEAAARKLADDFFRRLAIEIDRLR